MLGNRDYYYRGKLFIIFFLTFDKKFLDGSDFIKPFTTIHSTIVFTFVNSKVKKSLFYRVNLMFFNFYS
jgi:hypothetical protein